MAEVSIHLPLLVVEARRFFEYAALPWAPTRTTIFVSGGGARTVVSGFSQTQGRRSDRLSVTGLLIFLPRLCYYEYVRVVRQKKTETDDAETSIQTWKPTTQSYINIGKLFLLPQPHSLGVFWSYSGFLSFYPW